jgi:hypothetical protein
MTCSITSTPSVFFLYTTSNEQRSFWIGMTQSSPRSPEKLLQARSIAL